MTREKAIKELKWFSGTTRLRLSANFWEALNTAIKALEQQPSEDCVSKAEVFNILSRNYCSYSVAADGSCVPSNYREGIYDEIKALPSTIPVQKWIPVSERLPEESLNSVIGWDAYRERCVFVQYIDGYFQITGSDECFDIVAWMPLPKPYKAERRE